MWAHCRRSVSASASRVSASVPRALLAVPSGRPSPAWPALHGASARHDVRQHVLVDGSRWYSTSGGRATGVTPDSEQPKDAASATAAPEEPNEFVRTTNATVRDLPLETFATFVGMVRSPGAACCPPACCLLLPALLSALLPALLPAVWLSLFPDTACSKECLAEAGLPSQVWLSGPPCPAISPLIQDIVSVGVCYGLVKLSGLDDRGLGFACARWFWTDCGSLPPFPCPTPITLPHTHTHPNNTNTTPITPILHQ
jgi:hypothetical protein